MVVVVGCVAVVGFVVAVVAVVPVGLVVVVVAVARWGCCCSCRVLFRGILLLKGFFGLRFVYLACLGSSLALLLGPWGCWWVPWGLLGRLGGDLGAEDLSAHASTVKVWKGPRNGFVGPRGPCARSGNGLVIGLSAPATPCSPPDVYPQDDNFDVFPRDANLGVGGGVFWECFGSVLGGVLGVFWGMDPGLDPGLDPEDPGPQSQNNKNETAPNCFLGVD